ncbi:MAG: radical SAM protein [Acidobacteria bacterium]|nr:radical SAM protein [Acidobacteriota bacterium]
MTRLTRIRRRLLAYHRLSRELRMIAKGLLSTRHVLLAHIIPIRRCNLSCAYCNEYDDHSKPVPLEVMLARIDRLASFGTSIITLSGGEPLLHPELDAIIRRIRQHGRLAGLITNGYLLTAERIERLNRAGLDHLQISIDNVLPDEVSKKSLKVLDKKLELLAEHADFHVNINSVLGSGVRHPEDALTITRRALALGFSSTVGVIHDDTGQMRPLDERSRALYQEIRRRTKSSYSRITWFQTDLVGGGPRRWRCRSGSRYLYICEDGLVHYCSQQRGFPAIPLEEYTPEMRRREFYTQKPCASRCTISCVQQVAAIDNWRAPQTVPGFRPYPKPASLVQLQSPSPGAD